MISEDNLKIKLNTALLVVNGRNNLSGEEPSRGRVAYDLRKLTNKTTDKTQVKVKRFRRRTSNKYSKKNSKENKNII